MKKTTPLFNDFQPVSKADWLAKVAKELKGKPISDLDFALGELKVSPFHHRDDFDEMPSPLPFSNGWEIGEDFIVNDHFIETNKLLLAALEAGVNAPRFVLSDNISAKNLAVLLDKLNLEMISTHFYFTNKNASPPSLLSDFLKYISRKKLAIKNIKAGFNWEEEKTVDPQGINRILGQLLNADSPIKALPVNGISYYSEKNPVKELTSILINGESYLRQYASGKYRPDFINQHLLFSVAVGKNYFLQIAKMRALVLLWSNVMKSYQINLDMPPIEAHLTPSGQSTEDNTNMIAATTQAMSAIIGGAKRLTVLPADAHRSSSSGFTRRIARNIQHLLQEESYFGRVADPAAGSYYLEKLTNTLAERAWEGFQESC